METTAFTRGDYDVISREYADLMECARKRCRSKEELDTINKAFELASKAHNGIRRRNSDPYILHPIAVAKIVVSDIGLGYKSICAALLHEVMDKAGYAPEDIRAQFGDSIASLVIGMSGIKAILDKRTLGANAESTKSEEMIQILLTLGDDARIILIKLADRLHSCRTIEYLPQEQIDKILTDTKNIFIPLADRLGLSGIKSEMENIWLRFNDPKAYFDITAKVNSSLSNKDEIINDFLVPIHETLRKNGIEYSFKKRVKTTYSIWNKIQTKHVTFEQISDLFAVRIIFTPPSSYSIQQERDECYRIFSLITDIYPYRKDRVRDWVSNPKPNGYECLHLTAIYKDNLNIEVQIRSSRMDAIASQGIAAHWNYKKLNPDTEENKLDKWIARIKEILRSNDSADLDMLDFVRNGDKLTI